MSILKELIHNFRILCSALKDPRSHSPALRYSMEDIALSGFAVFFTQSQSFLEYQRRFERNHQASNSQSLFEISSTPSDNHIRNILDEVSPEDFYPQFRYCFETLEKDESFNNFKVLGEKILIAMDGTQHYSSSKISCCNCSVKKFKSGDVHSHGFVGASLCAPNLNKILPLEPEFITPQDGHKKQDCERAAAKRWLKLYGEYYANKGGVILGDDLYACQPLCEAILAVGLDFILVSKPESHKILYEYIDGAEISEVIKQIKKGQSTNTVTLRFINDIPINGSAKSLNINWIEIVEKDKSGKLLYRNAFVTNMIVTKENVFDISLAGRARWKIENETFNTLKTKGYNLEHNYGHGNKNLSNVFATMNLLAFACHGIADILCHKYRKINELIKCRREFFEEIRVATKLIVFTSWDHLFDTILDSFKPNIRDGTRKKS